MRRFTTGAIAATIGLAIVLSGCVKENSAEGNSALTTTVRPTLPPGTSPDDAYLISVERMGLRGVGFSDQDLVAAANQACGALGGGASGPEVISRLNDGFSGQLSPFRLSQLLGIMVTVYCPNEDARVRQELGG